MTRSVAEDLLRPHLDAIRSAINDGWADWLHVQSSKRTPARIRSGTRANLVYDFVTERLEGYFDSQGIVTTRKHQYLQVIFPGEKLVLRFKKFRDRQLRTSGIPTMHRLAVQAQQEPFEGMEVTYVVAGYLPDATGLELERLALVCSYYNEVLWSIDLESETSAVIPVHTSEPEAPVVRSVRPAAKMANEEEK